MEERKSVIQFRVEIHAYDKETYTIMIKIESGRGRVR